MKLGEWGENKATKYLTEKGYRIITRNFRCKFGEIDIIAFDKNEETICFIEVKTRKCLRFGMPKEAINRIKMLHILNTARYYILINDLSEVDLRIDVIEIIKSVNGEFISHTTNIS